MQDHRVTIQELAEEVGISTGLVHSILTNDLALQSVREIRAEADSNFLGQTQHSCGLTGTLLSRHGFL